MERLGCGRRRHRSGMAAERLRRSDEFQLGGAEATARSSTSSPLGRRRRARRRLRHRRSGARSSSRARRAWVTASTWRPTSSRPRAALTRDRRLRADSWPGSALALPSRTRLRPRDADPRRHERRPTSRAVRARRRGCCPPAARFAVFDVMRFGRRIRLPAALGGSRDRPSSRPPDAYLAAASGRLRSRAATTSPRRRRSGIDRRERRCSRRPRRGNARGTCWRTARALGRGTLQPVEMILALDGRADDGRPPQQLRRHQIAEPVLAGLGAADRQGLQRHARLQGGLGRRGLEDARRGPAHRQRQRPALRRDLGRRPAAARPQQHRADHRPAAARSTCARSSRSSATGRTARWSSR